MPELRKDPITGRWVIISTERGRRPMDFLRETVAPLGQKNCPFCPGSEGKTPPEILVYGRNGGGANTPVEHSRAPTVFRRSELKASSIAKVIECSTR